MMRDRFASVRFMQSKACPNILAAFVGPGNRIGVKLTMSGRTVRESWDKGPPESQPGATFNANDKHWEPINPARMQMARDALSLIIEATPPKPKP